MIEIVIRVKNNKVLDQVDTKKTTLLENAIALRRLKEIEKQLLDIEYKTNFTQETIQDDEENSEVNK